jgi:prevent-host-death family protein
MTTTSTTRGFVPITQFNKGQASKIFDRLAAERHIVVLKNNAPAAVLVSYEEFDRMRDAEIDLQLLAEAQERIAADPEFKTAIPSERFWEMLGVTDEDVASAPDVVIE